MSTSPVPDVNVLVACEPLDGLATTFLKNFVKKSFAGKLQFQPLEPSRQRLIVGAFSLGTTPGGAFNYGLSFATPGEVILNVSAIANQSLTWSSNTTPGAVVRS